MSDTHALVVAPDGTSRYFVESGADRCFASIGKRVATWRSSHVETWSSLSVAARAQAAKLIPALATSDDLRDFKMFWWADLTPVGGPVLGPFDMRDDALIEEKAWLLQHNLPESQIA